MLDAEEALKMAQKKNDDLETQAEELKKQAEEAKVGTRGYSASHVKFKSVGSPFHCKILAAFQFFSFSRVD